MLPGDVWALPPGAHGAAGAACRPTDRPNELHRCSTPWVHVRGVQPSETSIAFPWLCSAGSRGDAEAGVRFSGGCYCSAQQLALLGLATGSLYNLLWSSRLGPFGLFTA